MKRIAVSLLSGGLDSCVASAWAKQQRYELYLLSVNYGQVMRRELEHARRIADFLRPVEHRVLVMEDFSRLSRSSRTDADLIEYDGSSAGTSMIPAAYPPGRDATFLFIASAWAESLLLADPAGIDSAALVIGTNANDAAVFPDCNPTVYKLLNDLLAISTKAAVQYGKTITVTTPLLNHDKAEVIRLGLQLGAPLHATWSCYQGGAVACGRCDPCRLRLWAFQQNGIPDPVAYATEAALR